MRAHVKRHCNTFVFGFLFYFYRTNSCTHRHCEYFQPALNREFKIGRFDSVRCSAGSKSNAGYFRRYFVALIVAMLAAVCNNIYKFSHNFPETPSVSSALLRLYLHAQREKMMKSYVWVDNTNGLVGRVRHCYRLNYKMVCGETLQHDMLMMRCICVLTLRRTLSATNKRLKWMETNDGKK